MTRYAAFLRAVNVGGRVVKMEQLRTLFARAGFDEVSTLIASGNVVFESKGEDSARLEKKMEKVLAGALGYEVAVFMRTVHELQASVSHPAPAAFGGATMMIGFLKSAPAKEAVSRVIALSSEIDVLAVHGREVIWYTRGHLGQSKLAGGLLEKTLGMPMTMRNATTVRKAVEKLRADG